MIATFLRLTTSMMGPFGPTDIDPDTIRDVACDVTAPAQVCSPPDPDLPDPPDTPDVGVPASGIGLFGWVLVIALVVVLLAAIVWLFLRWWQSRTASDSDDSAEGGTDVDVDDDQSIDARIIDEESPPERWRRRAAEHRDAGRYRDSIRCEYRALVGELARAGYLDEIPGRTSGEERVQMAELASGPGPSAGSDAHEVVSEFDVAADTFDGAWFDIVPVTRDDDDRFLAARTAVLDVALAGSRLRGRR